MDHPYRVSENESIIIDTRLSALEEDTKSVVTWRRLASALFFVVVAVITWALYKGKSRTVAETTCQDEVLLVSTGVWSNTTAAKCSHPDHDSAITLREHDVIIRCSCH